ncbi:hypothetical protein [Nitrosospira sp. Nsp11]|uniref:hypothetical protein n=1 Tax=Nitrosospira sp. Nsp11 TaxID=1855338 RepID=UPI0015B49134|nr:hypothetical protein [Nitrosospira sp. Nsp11]
MVKKEFDRLFHDAREYEHSRFTKGIIAATDKKRGNNKKTRRSGLEQECWAAELKARPLRPLPRPWRLHISFGLCRKLVCRGLWLHALYFLRPAGLFPDFSCDVFRGSFHLIFIHDRSPVKSLRLNRRYQLLLKQHWKSDQSLLMADTVRCITFET